MSESSKSGKRGPLLEEAAMLSMVRTVDRTQIHFVRLFRGHGLTSQQYNVLRILRGAGGPLPCLEVAARMVTVVPAITGLLDRLEQAGLVARMRSGEDRRVVHVELTANGRRCLDKLEAPLTQLHQELLGHMSAQELETLDKLAAKARKAAE